MTVRSFYVAIDPNDSIAKGDSEYGGIACVKVFSPKVVPKVGTFNR